MFFTFAYCWMQLLISNKFATAHYKLKFWCQCGDTNTPCFGLKPGIRIALPILYLSFLVDRIPQWSLQFLKFLKLVKLFCYEPLDYFIVSLILICLLSFREIGEEWISNECQEAGWMCVVRWLFCWCCWLLHCHLHMERPQFQGLTLQMLQLWLGGLYLSMTGVCSGRARDFMNYKMHFIPVLCLPIRSIICSCHSSSRMNNDRIFKHKVMFCCPVQYMPAPSSIHNACIWWSKALWMLLILWYHRTIGTWNTGFGILTFGIVIMNSL